MLKQWDLIISAGDNGVSLNEKWACKVEIAQSDFILQSTAMASNNDSGELFVGTKTKHIIYHLICQDQVWCDDPLIAGWILKGQK